MKKKLTAAVAMLVVSAVMLSGVSYAWYTLSTNPSVENIKANIAANENLEIALDNGYQNETDVDAASTVGTNGPQGSTTGNPYTWGNLVDLEYAMTTGEVGKNLKLAPVKYDTSADKNFKYPQYGNDGRVNKLENLTSSYVSDLASVTTAKGGVEALKQTDNATAYDALGVTYWLRSNEDATVQLSEKAKRANAGDAATSGVNTTQGQGSYIEIPVSGENTAAIVKNYAKHLVVQLNVESEDPIYANLDAGTVSANNDKVTFKLSLKDKKTSDTSQANKTIALKANKAKKVTMYVYVDGETVTNKDALLDDITGITMNIQFASNTTDTPGAMNGTDTATN